MGDPVYSRVCMAEHRYCLSVQFPYLGGGFIDLRNFSAHRDQTAFPGRGQVKDAIVGHVSHACGIGCRDVFLIITP